MLRVVNVTSNTAFMENRTESRLYILSHTFHLWSPEARPRGILRAVEGENGGYIELGEERAERGRVVWCGIG